MNLEHVSQAPKDEPSEWTDQDNEIDNILKAIDQALILNKIITEKFQWYRKELSNKLDSLPVNDSFNDDNEDEKIGVKFLKLSSFQKPYIKDNRGLSGPSLFNACNEFVLDSYIQGYLINPQNFGYFSKKEQDKIRREVCSQSLFKNSRSIVKQLEEILALKKRTPEQLDEIKKLNSELALMKNRQEEPERFDPELDWLLISKNLSLNDDSRNYEQYELFYNNYLHKDVNRQKWSTDEDEKLLELVVKHGENNWDMIAKQIGNGRLAWQCCSRYQTEFNPSMKRTGPIAGEEAKQIDGLIENSKTITGAVNWAQISKVWEGRQLSQIKNYYRKQQKQQSNKRQTWTQLEDSIIYAGVKLYGPNKYTLIAKHLPQRNNRQIRERYTYHLSFNNVRSFGNWTPEDDFKLLKHCAKYLKNNEKIDYSVMAQKDFPERNPHQLLGRFKALKQKLTEDFYLKHLDKRKYLRNPINVKTRNIKKPRQKMPILPDDPKELLDYLQSLSKKLKSISNENQNWKQPCEKIHFSDPWEIDDCLQLYMQLRSFANFFHRKIIHDGNIDLRVKDSLHIVLSELLNLNDTNQNESMNETTISPFTLDIIRFFITNTSTLINEQDGQMNCLFVPNHQTIVGYAMIQLLFNSLLIRSAELDMDFNEDSTMEMTEFQDLRSVFISLFLWPALLLSIDEDDDDELFAQIKQKTACLETNKKNTQIEVKTLGRPKKKKFPHGNDFFKLRSFQKELFQSELVYSDLGVCKPNEYWIREPQTYLMERVRIFVEHTQQKVEGNLQQIQLSNQSKTKRKRKQIRYCGRRSKRVKNNNNIQVKNTNIQNDVRRSNRLLKKKTK